MYEGLSRFAMIVPCDLVISWLDVALLGIGLYACSVVTVLWCEV